MNESLPPAQDFSDLGQGALNNLYAARQCHTEGEKIALPPPPEGKEWHNPEGLTPEQVGVLDGWRLLLKDELIYDYRVADCQFWQDGYSEWENNWWHGESSIPREEYTYRTRRQLPERATLIAVLSEAHTAICAALDFGINDRVRDLLCKMHIKLRDEFGSKPYRDK